MISHDEVRSMYCRGEIDRETLWHWVGKWAHEHSGDLPLSSLAEARWLALQTGERLWTALEEDTLSFDELQTLSAGRREQCAAFLVGEAIEHTPSV